MLSLFRIMGVLVLVSVVTRASELPASCSGALNLPGEEVVARLMTRNNERAQQLHGFVSIRQYSLDYLGFPPLSARMEVKATYTAPGTKTFTAISESGVSLLRNQVLRRLLEVEREAASDKSNRDAVALNTTNYRFALLACERSTDRPSYIMHVEPLRQSKLLYRGTIWIDSQDFAVTRIEAEPSTNPSFWTTRSRIHHQYQKIGQFYLPEFNRTVSEVRLGGTAILTIRYLDYRLAIH
jgi:hypothetical protein